LPDSHFPYLRQADRELDELWKLADPVAAAEHEAEIREIKARFAERERKDEH
jgi:hypothetical protein